MVMHMKVKSVFLLTKPGDRGIVGKARGLAGWLRGEGYIVFVLPSIQNLRVLMGVDMWMSSLKKLGVWRGAGIGTRKCALPSRICLISW